MGANREGWGGGVVVQVATVVAIVTGSITGTTRVSVVRVGAEVRVNSRAAFEGDSAPGGVEGPCHELLVSGVSVFQSVFGMHE